MWQNDPSVFRNRIFIKFSRFFFLLLFYQFFFAFVPLVVFSCIALLSCQNQWTKSTRWRSKETETMVTINNNIVDKRLTSRHRIMSQWNRTIECHQTKDGKREKERMKLRKLNNVIWYFSFSFNESEKLMFWFCLWSNKVDKTLLRFSLCSLSYPWNEYRTMMMYCVFIQLNWRFNNSHRTRHSFNRTGGGKKSCNSYSWMNSIKMTT